MNGWWTYKAKNFPPSKDIEPLLISMHIRNKIRKNFLKRNVKEYLTEHGPVGCRDMSTCEYLLSNGVPAYFSGCLTLTLQKNPNIKRKNYVLTVDISKELSDAVKSRTNIPVYDISRLIAPNSPDNRFNIAKAVLYLYQSAHCVITSRLHCALPCLAFETPFVFVESNDGITFDGRFDGFKNLFNMVKEDDLISRNIYNFETPPANPNGYQSIREQLIKTCSEFTGYNNEQPLLEDNNEDSIIVNLVKSMEYENIIKRSVWFIKSRDIIRTLYEKRVLHKDKYHITN